MKVRMGFVSNSSSTSFAIIGVKRRWAEKLADKDGIEKRKDSWYGEEDEYYDLPYGYEQGKKCKDIAYFGCGRISYAGLSADKVLQNMTIPQACRHFRDLMKAKFGVEIPFKQIGFHFGESSSE